MKPDLKQMKIKNTIKALLKRKGHTYGDLAKIWDCSLPTVKRQLGSEELPLSRLLSLLEWLDISLGELHKLVDLEGSGHQKYTVKQNEFLAKNPREFALLLYLYQMPAEQIAKKFKIPDLVFEKMLIQLEKHDLIKVGSTGKIKPSHATAPSFDGALGRIHVSRAIDRAGAFHKACLSRALNDPNRAVDDRKATFAAVGYQLSKVAYDEFHDKILQIQKDMANTSRLEQNSEKKSELKVGVFTFGIAFCEPDDPNLDLLKNYFEDDLRGLGSKPDSEDSLL